MHTGLVSCYLMRFCQNDTLVLPECPPLLVYFDVYLQMKKVIILKYLTK